LGLRELGDLGLRRTEIGFELCDAIDQAGNDECNGQCSRNGRRNRDSGGDVALCHSQHADEIAHIPSPGFLQSPSRAADARKMYANTMRGTMLGIRQRRPGMTAAATAFLEGRYSGPSARPVG
jgi:hypothetical protein